MAVTIDYSAWPTGDDLKQFLVGANIWPSDSVQAASAERQAQSSLDAAVREFEERTGWYPFLASDDAAEARVFTASDPQGVLDLEAGLLSLASVSVGGTAQTLNQNVYLQPANAASRRKPFTELLFSSPWVAGGGGFYAKPNSIVVTGRWGRVTEVPPDVWNAVLRKGAQITLTSTNQDSDVSSMSKDGFSIQFDPVGVIDPKTLLANLGKEFDGVIAYWKRVVC